MIAHRVRPVRSLSRALARGRWAEYRHMLTAALASGYEVVSLESWIDAGRPVAGRTLILRHDVDQHPRSALRMASIEVGLSVSSTWYFRWRTADPSVIRWLRERGFSVGLHYETLTRRVLDGKLDSEAIGDDAIAEQRAVLRREIEIFDERHGPIRSVCPHGDSRVPGVSNAVLLRDEDCASYGVDFDGNEAMRGAGLAYWLTDRSRAEGGWKNGVDPSTLLADGVSPILCLTHPNNWASGGSLWLDRVMTFLLPAARADRHRARGLIRTLDDWPPL